LEPKLQRKCGNNAEKLQKASSSAYSPQKNDIGLQRICGHAEKMRKIKLLTFSGCGENAEIRT